MKKLYYTSVDVMFVSEHEPSRREATSFLKEQLKCHDPEAKEVTDLNQVPNDWIDALVFGTNFDITPRKFLELKSLTDDPEYKEYMRLKDKFENQKLSNTLTYL